MAVATVSISTEFLQCRVYLHAWDDEVGLLLPPSTWGYPVDLRCTRCGTIRRDILDVNMNLASRRYVYPEGYRISSDLLPSRAEFRQMEMDRLKVIARSSRSKTLQEQVNVWADRTARKELLKPTRKVKK